MQSTPRTFECSAPRRSTSAPPVLGSCRTAPARIGKKSNKSAAAASSKRAAELDDAALRDFAARAHEKRWVDWAKHLLSRRRAVTGRWNRVTCALDEKELKPSTGFRKKRKKAAAAAVSLRAVEPDEDAALRDFAARAREERWTGWAKRLLSRRRVVAWRWNRMTRAVHGKELEPALRATLSGRAFMHVLQYAMRPLDLVQFYCAAVLRVAGTSTEIWATDAATQAVKVKNLIRAAEEFAALTRRCEIMLHLPNRSMFVLSWEPDFPISALQGKALCECGLPPERQRLQCLGQDLQSDTVGRSGVLPGDVIDVIALAEDVD